MAGHKNRQNEGITAKISEKDFNTSVRVIPYYKKGVFYFVNRENLSNFAGAF